MAAFSTAYERPPTLIKPIHEALPEDEISYKYSTVPKAHNTLPNDEMSYEYSAVQREASAVACANIIERSTGMVYYNGAWVFPPIMPDISRHTLPTESIGKLNLDAKFSEPAKVKDWKKRDFRNLDIRPISQKKATRSPLKMKTAYEAAYEEDFAAYKQSSSSSSSETTPISKMSNQSAGPIESVPIPFVFYPEPKARSKSTMKSILQIAPKSGLERPSRTRKRPSRYRSPQPCEFLAV